MKVTLTGVREYTMRRATWWTVVVLIIVVAGLVRTGVVQSAGVERRDNDIGNLSRIALLAPVVVGSGWQPFHWTAFGGEPVDNYDGAFTFTSHGSVMLTVADVGCKGDQFKVFNNGVEIGVTSAPTDAICDETTTNDPDVAFADPTYSHGTFQLGPGDYAITFRTIVNPWGSGQAYFRVDADGPPTNSPPDCSNAEPSTARLTPANHKFKAITVRNVTDPDGDDVTITITSIRQDEAVDARDSGNTVPDGQGVGTSTAQGRAERVESGNGRVYHIGFTANDGQGGICMSEILVSVPVGNRGTAVDEGALFDSTTTP
jgi:hypothetical protein